MNKIILLLNFLFFIAYSIDFEIENYYISVELLDNNIIKINVNSDNIKNVSFCMDIIEIDYTSKMYYPIKFDDINISKIDNHINIYYINQDILLNMTISPQISNNFTYNNNIIIFNETLEWNIIANYLTENYTFYMVRFENLGTKDVGYSINLPVNKWEINDVDIYIYYRKGYIVSLFPKNSFEMNFIYYCTIKIDCMGNIKWICHEEEVDIIDCGMLSSSEIGYHGTIIPVLVIIGMMIAIMLLIVIIILSKKNNKLIDHEIELIEIN